VSDPAVPVDGEGDGRQFVRFCEHGDFPFYMKCDMEVLEWVPPEDKDVSKKCEGGGGSIA